MTNGLEKAKKLTWRAQFANPTPRGNDPLLHFAQGDTGTFEIFEDGPNCLLHFPRGMKRPAELFSNLDLAKAAAQSLDTGGDEA